MASPLQKRVLGWAKTFVLVGGLWLLTAVRAAAQCGSGHGVMPTQIDYAPSPSSNSGASPRVQAYDSTSSKAGAATPCDDCHGSGGIPDQAPCQGPFCSGLPIPDTVPASGGGSTNSQDQWIIGLLMPVVDPQRLAWCYGAGPSADAFQFNDSVFHPPRQV